MISRETADSIDVYYQRKSSGVPNRQFIIFGILGAILVGLGIILIIAHNWDNLGKGMKTFFAFLPLVLSQTLCGYVLLKRRENVGWREVAGTFLFFAIGASISMVAQIYQISGDLPAFLMTWMLLSIPVAYLMNSAVVSMLCICGITYYVTTVGYSFSGSSKPWAYWGMLGLLFPFYYLLLRKNADSNFVRAHHWLLAGSVIIALGCFGGTISEFLFLAYMSLFGLFYQVGSIPAIKSKFALNGYLILSILGTLVLLLIMSFNFIWEYFLKTNFTSNDLLTSSSFYLAVILSVITPALFLFLYKEETFGQLSPFSYAWAVFLVVFVIGMFSPVAVVLVNVMVLLLGLYIMQQGNVNNHLGLLNFGLLIIATLVTCRFFDTDLSFVIRGLLFISVGLGFFLANYWLLKKRKAHEIR